MYLPIDEDLLERFKAVLKDPAPKGRQKEQVIQDFLENNSALIPLPNLENHGLHMSSIISKFPLGTALTTDYTYLTKSSSRWVVTFVELETSDKPIFTNNMDRPTFSATFNAAVSQVAQWQNYVEENRVAVRASLAKLLHPMSDNKLTFQYQLIIGRSNDKNLSEERKAAFELQKMNTGINIFTYDSLISYYKNLQREEKNILSASKDRFILKSLSSDFGPMLGWFGPDALKFSTEQREILKERGYRIDEWFAGKLLAVNGKWPLDQDREAKEALRAVTDKIIRQSDR